MLAFNFASRYFAYKRLAQVLSRSVSAFSSFTREYLDLVVKADQCAQYVDDSGTAANNATDLTRNIRAVSKCICQARLKLTIENFNFGVRQVEFLARTISAERVSPQPLKIRNFPSKLRFLKSKCFAALSGVRNLLQTLVFQNGWKAQPILQTFESRSRNQNHIRIERNLWFNK